jgi:hypothetical protein
MRELPSVAEEDDKLLERSYKSYIADGVVVFEVVFILFNILCVMKMAERKLAIGFELSASEL